MKNENPFIVDKPIIYLPSGPAGGGFVTVLFDQASVTAEYSAGKVELLLILNRARLADGHLDSVARGWRSPDQITVKLEYPIEEASLRRAVSQVNRTFREAANRGALDFQVPSLITTKRNIGLRLTWQLEVQIPGLSGHYEF